jgi:UDP-glucose 4-epimerase
MARKILVTGGCGWLGGEIVRTLLARGDSVVATDLAISAPLAAQAQQQPRLTTAVADLGEWSQVVRLLEAHRPSRARSTCSRRCASPA